MSELPSGWVQTSLGAVCARPQYGWTTSASKDALETTALRFLRTTDITRGRLDWEAVPYCKEEPPRPEQYLLAPGDIVISRAGSIGFSYRLVDVEPAVFASYLIRFRPSQLVDGRYVASFLQSPRYWQQVRAAAAGIALANVNAKKLAAIELPLAPRAEQERVVAVIEEQLSRLDAGVVVLERVRLNLKRVRAAVLQAAVSGQLTGAFAAAHLDSPSERDVVTVGDIAEVSGGITKNPKRQPRSNPISFLRVANVQRDALDLNDVHEIEVFEGELDKLRLRRGDLLVVEGNGSPDQIGRSAIWDGSIDPCVHQNHLIRVRPGTRVLPAYLNLFWNAPSSIATIRAIASSTSGLYTLSTGKVRSIPVVLPPIAAQERIVAEVERQLSFVEALDSELVKACALGSSLRSSVLSAAFSGKLVPQDPNDEPASILLERIADERASSNGHNPVKARSRRQRKVIA